MAAVQHVTDIGQLTDEYVESYAQAGVIPNASAKRLREFVAGRFCAERCLAQHRQFEAVVEVAEDRSPVWPTGFVGSISHTDEIAWAVVARQGRIRSIGIDCEQLVDEATIDETLEQIVNPDELIHLQASGLTRTEAFTLAFSVKEAIYKCLFPIGFKSLKFRDFEVMGVDGKELNVNLPVTCASVSNSLQTQHAFDRDHVFTMCTLRD